MRRTLSCILLAACALSATAQAQTLGGERMLPQPVDPGRVAPWRPAGAAPLDPGESRSLYVAPTGPTLADWYAAQGRPALALFFDRRLERLPPGWDGTARLRFGYEGGDGQRTTEVRQLTIGVEHKEATRSVRERSPLVVLIEGALLRELQSARLRLVDPTVAERALASRKGGGDTEFDSLRNAANYVLEVELVAAGDSVSMVGNLKNLRNSEMVATVRQPVEQDLRSHAEVDVLAQRFVRRLLAVPAQPR